MKQSYRGQAKQAANALWGSSAAHVRYKHVTVVDDDIDIHDYAAVDWAIAHRVNAGENDIVIMPATFGAGLDPSTRRRDRNPDAVRHRQMEPGADRRHHQSRLRPRSGSRRRALPADGLAEKDDIDAGLCALERARARQAEAEVESSSSRDPSASRQRAERVSKKGFGAIREARASDKVAGDPGTTERPADDRASRHHSVRGPEALRHRARAGRAASRASGAPPSWCCTASAATRPRRTCMQPDQGARRPRLRDAALRHARLRRQRRRARPRDLPRAGRGHPQRADLPGQSIPRSIPSASALIGSSFGGAVAVYAGGVDERVAAVISNGGWGDGERKFRGQHKTPGGMGALHRHAGGRPRAPRQDRQVADGAALRHRADPAAPAQQPGRQLDPLVPGRDRAEHVRLPRRRRGRQDRAASAAAAALRRTTRSRRPSSRSSCSSAPASRPSCTCSATPTISCSARTTPASGTCCADGSSDYFPITASAEDPRRRMSR